VKLLLDTHFLLWILFDLPRMSEFSWLDRYRPWGVSPISLLELQLLAESGRLEVRHRELVDALGRDSRFVIDEVPLMALVEHALALSWTRDPFDRLLAAHSQARRAPLCTLDQRIREEHDLIVRELRDR
jgi:PIN domain nuclease of toxin-antitoxin system